MEQRNLNNIIGKAIRDADTTLFRENYNKQAAAVQKALAKEKMTIIPEEPSDEMIEYMVDNMPLGRMTPNDLMREIYRTVVENALKMR